MDAVAITVSGQTFKVSKAALKKHSRYFDECFGDGNMDHGHLLPGVQADAFAVLVTYITKSELNITDKSMRLLKDVQDTACFLGITLFPQDLEKALKTSWSKMANLNTVFNLAARLGVHSSMMCTVVDDVLKVILQPKEIGNLRESDLTYEILIFVCRLGMFWESLIGKCKYFYTYENFFGFIVSWIAKNNTTDENVKALVSSLNIFTVSSKFLNDAVANSSGIPEMKEQLKYSLQKRQAEVSDTINQRIRRIRLTWYDVKQGYINVHDYNPESFTWDERLRFSRLPMETVFCISSQAYVYAIGDQTLTHVRFQGGSAYSTKFPERLEITYCCTLDSSLFCFGWNRRDHVFYEFDPERRKFTYKGVTPFDSNIVATAHQSDLYIMGETLQASVKNNDLRVFKYSISSGGFETIAVLKKKLCNPEQSNDSSVEEIGSNFTSHLVVTGRELFVLMQERSSSLKTELYIFQICLDSSNTGEVQPRKVNYPVSLDKHANLVNARESADGILMLFRSPSKGDYIITLLDHNKNVVYQLGFLPYLSGGHNISLEHTYLMSNNESDFHIQLSPVKNAQATSSKSGKTTSPKSSTPNKLDRLDSPSEETLVTDVNELSPSIPEDKQVNYRSPKVEDLKDGNYSGGNSTRNSYTADSLSYVPRISANRSSLSSAASMSSRSSMRSSKKGSKKSLASRGVSVVSSLFK